MSLLSLASRGSLPDHCETRNSSAVQCRCGGIKPPKWPEGSTYPQPRLGRSARIPRGGIAQRAARPSRGLRTPKTIPRRRCINPHLLCSPLQGNDRHGGSHDPSQALPLARCAIPPRGMRALRVGPNLGWAMSIQSLRAWMHPRHGAERFSCDCPVPSLVSSKIPVLQNTG